MRIKAKMLLPRKEVDAQGQEIDPRQELIDKILDTKKQGSGGRNGGAGAERLLQAKRGNVLRELAAVGEEAGEGTEIQAITLFKLMKAFKWALERYSEKHNKPVHTVVQYNYSMEATKADMISTAQRDTPCRLKNCFNRWKTACMPSLHFYRCWNWCSSITCAL